MGYNEPPIVHLKPESERTLIDEIKLGHQGPEAWLTLIAAAEELGVRPDTLRQQIHNGKLTGEKRGRDWFVHIDEVARYSRESGGRYQKSQS